MLLQRLGQPGLQLGNHNAHPSPVTALFIFPNSGRRTGQRGTDQPQGDLHVCTKGEVWTNGSPRPPFFIPETPDSWKWLLKQLFPAHLRTTSPSCLPARLATSLLLTSTLPEQSGPAPAACVSRATRVGPDKGTKGAGQKTGMLLGHPQAARTTVSRPTNGTSRTPGWCCAGKHWTSRLAKGFGGIGARTCSTAPCPARPPFLHRFLEH